VITNRLHLFTWKVSRPSCSFNFFDEPSQLSKFIDATFHNVLIIISQNHLNLCVSSLASLPFPFNLIDSAKAFTNFFLKSVLVAFFITGSANSISILAFNLAFKSLTFCNALAIFSCYFYRFKDSIYFFKKFSRTLSSNALLLKPIDMSFPIFWILSNEHTAIMLGLTFSNNSSMEVDASKRLPKGSIFCIYIPSPYLDSNFAILWYISVYVLFRLDSGIFSAIWRSNLRAVYKSLSGF